ncbi:MAG: phosphoribosyltransferase [Candidatus Thiodiazotropha sp.]|jgi:hypoxanthine phosphoribosyltransferase
MRVNHKYEYISWSEFYRLCGRLYEQISISGFRPDTIIAIARGGYSPARIMADYFSVMNLLSLKIEHYHGPDKMPRAVVCYPLTADLGGKQVLLMDDVSDSGDTFSVALDHLKGCGAPARLCTAVLHHKATSSFKPDYYAKRLVKWRWITYPWALVEDLSVLASRIRPPPKDENELRTRLRNEMGITLPKRLFSRIAPVVLYNVDRNMS